jgi:hypothetical protein
LASAGGQAREYRNPKKQYSDSFCYASLVYAFCAAYFWVVVRRTASRNSIDAKNHLRVKFGRFASRNPSFIMCHPSAVPDHTHVAMAAAQDTAGAIQMGGPPQNPTLDMPGSVAR